VRGGLASEASRLTMALSRWLRGVAGGTAVARLLGACTNVVRSARSPFLRAHPAGHFYSPLPDAAELRRDAARLFPDGVTACPGIDLRPQAQLAVLAELAPLAADVSFPRARTPGFRYWQENGFFGPGDALVLHAMLRRLRPARVIEVGSGFSSAVMLDTAERFLDPPPRLTFIEPAPALLHSLLGEADRSRCEVLVTRVQDVPPGCFDALGAGDLLFVDSSHVLKAGSDVAHLLFDVLPRLAPGVTVHFHDVHWPFEYPRVWFEEGRAWNEAYALRAFLQFNAAFRIVYFNAYIAAVHPAALARLLPGAVANPGGGLWLEREAADGAPSRRDLTKNVG
jgi:predicted O-methyltransferase YrrM